MRTTLISALAATSMLLVACGGDDTDAGERVVQSWSVAADPASATGNEVAITVRITGCGPFDGVTVDESADEVVIEAYITERAGDACATVVIDEPVTVTLDAPLGDRALRGCLPADPAIDCREFRG